MIKPQFITFTGADDQTSVEGMAELSAIYPIEWGILLSPKRVGTPRYPKERFLVRLIAHEPLLRLSAHLCGDYAREVINEGELDSDFMCEVIGECFLRAQINTAEPNVNTEHVREWAEDMSVAPILQTRGEFPTDINVQWLFDASGGRGITPPAWPVCAEPWQLRGYAGGLRPENVGAAVDQIGKTAFQYWIDMETGVRDENDRFDLARCRAVCEAVYGSRS